MKRIVELIAKNPKYLLEPYPFVCLIDAQSGDILNGLEFRAGDLEREDFLKQEEIRGQASVKPKARMDKFPPEAVIKRGDVVSGYHGQKLNLTLKNSMKSPGIFPSDYLYPRDFALYKFFLIQPNVANVLENYNADKHHFYLLDREYEAGQRKVVRKKTFDAQKFLQENVSLQRQKEIAMLIGFKTKDYQFGDVNKLSATLIEDKLYEIAGKSPELILACDPELFKDVPEEMFVVAALDKGILKKKGVDYYDGSTYAGSDLLQLVKYVKSNNDIVLRWKAILDE